jgi:hypothetical protein
MTAFYLGSDQGEDASMRSKAPLLMLVGAVIVLGQAFVGVGVMVGTSRVSCLCRQRPVLERPLLWIRDARSCWALHLLRKRASVHPHRSGHWWTGQSESWRLVPQLWVRRLEHHCYRNGDLRGSHSPASNHVCCRGFGRTGDVRAKVVC